MPSAASPVYEGPFLFGPTSSSGVRAIAISDAQMSAVTAAAYQYVPKELSIPFVQPPAGFYDASVDVSLEYSGLGEITLCYTLDGSAPGCTSGGGQKQFGCLADGDVTATGGTPGTCVASVTYDGGAIRLEGAPGTSTAVKVMSCGYGTTSELTSAMYRF